MGRAMIQMASVFGEQERSILRSRVLAGLDRVRQQGKKLGRPKVSPKIKDAIRTHLSAGNGILKVAALVGVRKRHCAASEAGDGRGVGGGGVTDLRQCPFCVSVAPCDQDGANQCKATALDLPRRGFIAGLCAATAKVALTSADVIAGGDTTPTYRSAT